MRRESICKLLKLVSILLLIGFIIRVCCDYYFWDESNSLPFAFNVLFRAIIFLSPCLITFVMSLYYGKKMTHELRLDSTYFDYIKSGTKRVEIRLNDEKRKKINIGDFIIFYRLPEEKDSIKVVVTNLTRFKSFDSLLEYYEKKILADSQVSKNTIKKDLYKFYKEEDELKYGVLSIEFKVENN